MKTHRINVVSYILDHQDGGGSTTLYPSLEALREDRFPRSDFNSDEEYDKKWKEVIDEYDTYGNGEIGYTSIQISESDEGILSLAKEIYAHWGQ